MKRLFVCFMLTTAFFLSPQLPVAADEKADYLLVGGDQPTLIQYLHEQELVITQQYPSFSIISTRLTAKEKNQLEEKFPTIDVQENQQYRQSSTKTLQSINLVKANAEKTMPYTGKGVKIAVIDSGIDVSHPDLTVKDGHCSLLIECAYKIPFNDDHGHGTHVAGIIGASNPSKNIRGIAPEAELYSVKALNVFGYGSTNSLIGGIEWAMAHNIDIINMSITTDNHDVALEKALETAYQQGLLIVGSSGNNGEKTDKTVRYPAKYASVIAVSATNPDNTKLKESAIGPEVEIAAPGGHVYSTYPLILDHTDGKVDGYTTMSGTSMATPHVTGILALYKERFPKKTNDELRDMIAREAIDLGEPGKDSVYGNGLIQYSPTYSNTVPFDKHVETGKVTVTTNQEAVHIQANGRQVKQEEAGWVLYGVKGPKEMLVTSEANDGQPLVEKQFVTLTAPAYKDVTNYQPFSGPVGYLSHKDQIKGFDDGTFRPYKEITRAEAAVLIGRALGFSSATKTTKFTDVAPSSFASGYIDEAVNAGIITGFSDGSFRPEAQVTRAEMAILITKAFTLTEGSSKVFSDVVDSMASYKAIQQLSQSKVTTGYSDGTFKPYNSITRADFSVFLARVQDEQFK